MVEHYSPLTLEAAFVRPLPKVIDLRHLAVGHLRLYRFVMRSRFKHKRAIHIAVPNDEPVVVAIGADLVLANGNGPELLGGCLLSYPAAKRKRRARISPNGRRIVRKAPESRQK